MNEKTPRRVGSFSAGIFLILFGVGLLVCMFLPEPVPALGFLARFSPLLLILLGAELLLSYFRAKTTPVRFDGFSIVLCIVVLIFGLAASFASLGVRVAADSWQNQRYDAKLEAQAEPLAAQALAGEKDVVSLSVQFYLQGDWGTAAPSLQTALQEAPPHTHVTLTGDFEDETAFAARCQTLFKPLWEKGFRTVSFHAEHFSGGEWLYSYDLTLDSVFALTAPPEALYRP